MDVMDFISNGLLSSKVRWPIKFVISCLTFNYYSSIYIQNISELREENDYKYKQLSGANNYTLIGKM